MAANPSNVITFGVLGSIVRRGHMRQTYFLLLVINAYLKFGNRRKKFVILGEKDSGYSHMSDFYKED